MQIFCSRNFFVPFGTFFVPFGTYFAHDSTPPKRRRTTTTKLLLGPLSIARGQKRIFHNPKTQKNKAYLRVSSTFEPNEHIARLQKLPSKPERTEGQENGGGEKANEPLTKNHFELLVSQHSVTRKDPLTKPKNDLKGKPTTFQGKPRNLTGK